MALLRMVRLNILNEWLDPLLLAVQQQRDDDVEVLQSGVLADEAADGRAGRSEGPAREGGPGALVVLQQPGIRVNAR